MTLDLDKLNGKPQVIKRQKVFRCVKCGNDVNQVFPVPVTVSEDSFNKIKSIHNKDTNLQLINKSFSMPGVSDIIDDFTLKKIKGYAYYISIDFCLGCIDKMGWRHKFKNKGGGGVK